MVTTIERTATRMLGNVGQITQQTDQEASESDFKGQGNMNTICGNSGNYNIGSPKCGRQPGTIEVA